jgi:hypothetical protein
MAPELRGSWLERRQGSPMRTTSSPHRELTRCGRGKQRTKADLSRSKAVTRFREPRVGHAATHVVIALRYIIFHALR